MDRDKRFERTQKAYDLLTGVAVDFYEKDIQSALNNAYDRGESDEFVKAICLCKDSLINEQDSVIFYNFRADRMRQLTRCFINPEDAGFELRKKSVFLLVCYAIKKNLKIQYCLKSSYLKTL